MGKLKPGIQPSTSLLVCKRACCLRWRVESPVCHIHDVFPRDTQHTAPWQHDIYRPPTSFHPLLHSAQPLLLPSPLLCSASRISLPFPLLVLVSSAELSGWRRRSGGPALRLHCVAIRWIRLPRREPARLASLSTLDNSKLIPPNWLAGVPPRDPRMHAIIHARKYIYIRVFLESWITLIRYTRLEYRPTAPGCTREREREREDTWASRGESFVRFALENNHSSCSDVRVSLLIIYVVAPSVNYGRRTFKRCTGLWKWFWSMIKCKEGMYLLYGSSVASDSLGG